MARRCKEDAEQTRLNILKAARRVFARRGVSRTTLEDVAKAAGVTRGAVYWHFRNKMELFFAMREQTALPLIDDTDMNACAVCMEDPLSGVEEFLLGVMRALKKDPVTKSVFEIMTFKCEFVDELKPALSVQAKHLKSIVSRVAEAYRRAGAAGMLREGVDPEIAALETTSFLVGLLRLWLMDRSSAMVRGRTEAVIKAHIDARRVAASAPRPR